jgi:hypothetical protein
MDDPLDSWHTSRVRNLLIIILLGVCIWLLVERGNRTNEVEAMEKRIADKQIQLGELERGGGSPSQSSANTPASPSRSAQPANNGSWLDKHIDQGARALESKPANRR